MGESETSENPRIVILLLVLTCAFNLVMVSVRLLNGLPLAVDSTSHLFRVMLMTKSYQERGYLPQWNPYWYGGTTFTLLYPPLSYILTLIPSLLGLGPVLSYKLIDATFYLLGPLAVYHLSRNLGVSKVQGILAAFFLSFSPSIVENYLFYDRFPSIVSLPIVCLFLMTLSRALDYERNRTFLVTSGILFGTTILTHHLSALCAALLGLLMVISRALTNRRAARLHTVTQLLIIFVIGLALSSFWLYPFIAASSLFLNNPFYNRNVEFPFIRLSYFSINVVVYALGVAHFLLSVFVVWSFSADYKLKKRIVPATFALMMIGMAAFELGEKFVLEPVRIVGQITVVLSLFCLAYAILQRCITSFGAGFHLCTVILWFVTFFWLSLGSFALPFVTLYPISAFWRTLDVHRFWLYLTVAMSILSGIGLRRLSLIKVRAHKIRPWVIPALLLGIVVAGGCIKAIYTTTHNISEFLPYPPVNSDIPTELVSYFKSDPTYARILALRCPLWTYVLPYYTDKPLVDGWYPQGKLLKRILEINDYRILDLESAGPVEPTDSPNRTETWRNLILNSRLLAIKWVIVGNVGEETRSELFNGTSFKLDAQFSYQQGVITVYRTSEPIKMVEFVPSDVGEAVFSRDGPDRFTLRFLNVHGNPRVIVKEAYFPTWRATSGNVAVEIEKNEEGFMAITLPEGARELVLEQKPVAIETYYVSLISLVGSLVFVGVNVTRRKTPTRRRRY
jgi:hypothetical protein